MRFAKSFLVNGIAPELHKDFKVLCSVLNRTMQDVLIELVSSYVDQHLHLLNRES